MAKLSNGSISEKSFMRKFGHLRPGTFDIQSFRYDEKPELYLYSSKRSASEEHIVKSKFSFTTKDKNKLFEEFNNLDLKIDLETLLKFIEKSIKSREYSKFIFSRSLSDSLSLIKKWGKNQGISVDELSYLDIKHIYDFDSSIENKNLDFVKRKIFDSKTKNRLNSNIVLPDLINSVDDLFSFHMHNSKPNFITNKQKSGEIIKLVSKNENYNINDKIVFIESADPGYDWIFLHKIKGLVTKYGGAASHMAIRCAEFSLPAAIGCGNRFDNYSTGDLISLDCSNKQIKKL